MKRNNRNIIKTLAIALLSACCGACISCGLIVNGGKEITVRSFAMEEGATLNFTKADALYFTATMDETEYKSLKANPDV